MSDARGLDDLLAQVRAALGRSDDAPPPPPPIDDALVRVVPREADTVARFVEAAEVAGTRVIRSSEAQMRAALAALLDELGAARASMSVADEGLLAEVGAALRHAGVEPIAPVPRLDTDYDADVGITDVVAAVAETGSLVVSSTAGRGRGAFLVPPVHVALVRASQIVPDLLDLPLGAGALPAATILVTGPSKTADIEGILITGVHGPGEVQVVVIEGA